MILSYQPLEPFFSLLFQCHSFPPALASFPTLSPYSQLRQTTKSARTSLVQAVRASGVKRYLVVGGAGSLEVAPGKLFIDQPDFPAFVKAEAAKGKEYLDYLKGIKDLDWTFLSPSALFKAGERTGVFWLGGDNLLISEDGTSWISYEDYAIALLDEIENPKHIQQRFTVGY